MYTLNLFKSSFELAQLHSDKSPYLALWSAAATVDALHRHPAARQTFLLHDGPPYANGALHLGHFVNKTLKDALVKFKRLEGYFAPYVPGFDCHGLPVELEVEKLGQSKADPRAFVEACRAYAQDQVARQTAEFRSFGVAADWDQPYLTLEPAFEAGASALFGGLPSVAKRLRPVHWCPDCASSLAEAEVEYKVRSSDSLVALFAVEGRENTFLQVWTTTPYTLPANKAVAFNPALDYEAVGVEHYVDERGRFLQGEMAGMTLREATDHVLDRLGDLVHSCAPVQHEYPHCWRHKRPVFFKASEEWFLELAELGPRALAALKSVQFVPETARERLESMLRSRTSWCLSRHRLWGTPLADPDSDEDAALLARVARDGVEAWQAEGRRRTLDVWFDSGTTHELVMRKRFGRTADVYLEGVDQHRGWFQSSLLTAVAAGGPAPYKALLTHGFVVDEHGHKYSKSSRNYLPMEEMFQRYSPDVLRLWTLQQDFTKELKLSPQSLERTVDRYRKLRNTLRFCLQNLSDFDFGMPVELTHSLHRLQLVRLHELVATVQDAAGRYDFAAASSALMQYPDLVSSDYFAAVKDALYCEAPDSPRRREAQFVLGRVLDTLMRLLVPVLPYTAEEVFQRVREPMGCSEASSLLLTLGGLLLPEVDRAAELRATYDQLSDLKRSVHRHVEAGLASGLKSPAQLELEVTLPCSDGLFMVTPDEMRDFFGVARVGLAAGASAGVRVKRTSLGLCPRCRRHDRLPGHAALCRRCEEVEEAR
ncbi:class I tRNA ligase family protein [Variovorax sp. JS1663]|uniref:class I tRNA ligase family protein n=1 Tax=Variovorax sp. JS1663 TaxID=1851577 RepID=UPI000B3459F3|nr:class I tRNA ligase family protein [Variovorax sp. JS1663]OUM02254.1 hypothetical protein A8M77_11235 [Variovorax sp. JS1663]